MSDPAETMTDDRTDAPGDRTEILPAVVVGDIAAFHGATGFPLVCTPTGLALPDDVTFDEWEGLGPLILGAARSSMWWIGDWLRHGEGAYGTRYMDAVELTGLDGQTLRTAKMIAGYFPDVLRRRNNLSWSHHREVGVSTEAAEWEYWLDRCEDEGLSVHALRLAIRAKDVEAKEGKPEPAPKTAEQKPVTVAMSPERATRLAPMLHKLLDRWRPHLAPDDVDALTFLVETLDEAAEKAKKRAA